MPTPSQRPKPARARLSRVRVAVQVALHALLVGHVLAYYLLDWRAIGALDFQGFFRYFLGEGLLTAGALLALVVYGSALVFGRLFCSWGCHFGATQDLAAWAMRKLGWRPPLVRTRILHWAPFLLLGAAFLLPALRREREPLEAAGGGAWRLDVDLAAVAPWDTLPGWALSIATFAVCGAGLLLFLGTRGFCRFVCPYGAVFRLTDRVAPYQVRRVGPCRGSAGDAGKAADAADAAGPASAACAGGGAAPPCTLACPTAIDVHDETLRRGRVVSTDCVRCNLCIEACPSGALAHVGPGRARVLLAAAPPGASGPARADAGREEARRTLPLVGEVLILAVAAATYWAADGIYGGHFLAASLALAEGALLWSLLAAATGRRGLMPLGLRLRDRGGWTLAGAGAGLLLAATWVPLGEAAAFKGLRSMGVAAEGRALAGAGLSPEAAAGAAPAAREGLREAARLYRAALEWRPADAGARKLLIRALARLGDPEALREAERLVELAPADPRAAQILRWVEERVPRPAGGGT